MSENLYRLVRDVPDFPKPGIMFKDITPVLLDPAGLAEAIAGMVKPLRGLRIDKVAAIESRGFLLGAPVALALGVGLAIVRKPGKLPAKSSRIEYALEYGTDALEIHADALKAGDRVAIIDDVLATGGTARAAADLVRQCGAIVAGYGFLIELEFLSGRQRLGGDVSAVLSYR